MTTQTDSIPTHERKVFLEQHPEMFKAAPFSFLLALILVPIGIGLVIFLIWWLKVKTTKLVITDQEVEFHWGILNRDMVEVNHAAHPSVAIKQSLLQRIFGNGDITITRAGDDADLVIKGYDDPNEIKRMIDACAPQ
jgi:uncharacterized membrane protein YdbT with pleckstrin-like domain